MRIEVVPLSTLCQSQSHNKGDQEMYVLDHANHEQHNHPPMMYYSTKKSHTCQPRNRVKEPTPNPKDLSAKNCCHQEEPSH
jgi:hypothetical protein